MIWQRIVGPRRIDDFAVLEAQRQLQQAQGIVGQRVAVDLQLAHAPRVRMDGALHGFVQSMLVVLVLLLEVLRAQEQTLHPKELCLSCGCFLFRLALCVLQVVY